MSEKRGARPDTWMPLYWGDYLKDTGRLSTEGHGAYLLLIADYWTSGGPLPDDDEQLAAITRLPVARWEKLRRVIAHFFQVADGLWRHRRIDRELEQATAITKTRSEAGKEGANARWSQRQTDGSENGKRTGKRDGPAIREPMANAKQNDAPSQSPSPTPPSQPPSLDAEAEPARRVAGRFLDLRESLFPGHKPLAALTVIEHAKQFLSDGATEDIAVSVVERGLRQLAADGRTPPNSLRFFKNSMQDAIADARKKANGNCAHGDFSQSYAEREMERWRTRLSALVSTGVWPSSWGPKPGEPHFEGPPAILAEFGEALAARGVSVKENQPEPVP